MLVAQFTFFWLYLGVWVWLTVNDNCCALRPSWPLAEVCSLNLLFLFHLCSFTYLQQHCLVVCRYKTWALCKDCMEKSQTFHQQPVIIDLSSIFVFVFCCHFCWSMCHVNYSQMRDQLCFIDLLLSQLFTIPARIFHGRDCKVAVSAWISHKTSMLVRFIIIFVYK